MIHVRTSALAAAFERYGTAHKRLSADVIALMKTEAALSGMTGLEEAAEAIRTQRIRLGERMTVLGQLIKATDRIASCYQSCENSIADNAEAGQAAMNRRFIYNDLTRVADTMKDIQIIF